jgi:hypothetical protein
VASLGQARASDIQLNQLRNVPVVSISHLKVRILPPQPGIPVFGEFSFLDDKGPSNAGFSHRPKSPETGVRTFSAENSRKSPAEFNKTPVFRRLALETLE